MNEYLKSHKLSLDERAVAHFVRNYASDSQLDNKCMINLICPVDLVLMAIQSKYDKD